MSLPLGLPDERLPARQPMTLGRLMALLRQRRGISQNALAKVVGVNASYLNRLESGERTGPSADVTLGVAKALRLNRAATDALMAAAGRLPPSLAELGPLDPTVRILLAALLDERMTEDDRDRLRDTVENICETWQRKGQSTRLAQLESIK